MDFMNESYCVCCLDKVIDGNSKQYFITNEVLKLSFLDETLNLCFVCYKIAKNVVAFITNVQSNQFLLKNCKNLQESLQFKETSTIRLSSVKLEPIEVSGNSDSGAINELCQVLPSPNKRSKSEIVRIKEEIIAEYESDDLKCVIENFDECDDSIHVRTEHEKGNIDGENQSKKQIKKRKNGKRKILKVKKKAQKSSFKLEEIKLSGSEKLRTDQVLLNANVQQCDNLKVKEEITESNTIECDNLKVKEEITESNTIDFMSVLEDIDDCNDNVDTNSPEDEDEYPLKLLMAADMESKQRGNQIICLTNSKKKVKHKIKEEEKPDENGDDKQILEVIFLTKEQCENERNERAKDDKYVNAQYKCVDCVLGFTFEMSYLRHLEKHSKNAGDYICDICSLRSTSEYKLSMHMRSHQLRYRCVKCNMIRNDRATIKEHYAIAHGPGRRLECPHCFKTFLRRPSLKRHVLNIHSVTKPQPCPYCNKTLKNRDVLKSHMVAVHEKEVYKKEMSKRHVCAECGAAFRAPSQLKYHAVKHSHRRDHYCVECDKSFKSEYILKHHLKTALPHVTYQELPLGCLQCDKRFAIKRDVERHMNRVHFNIKPFQCDQCAKSYINEWSLKDHKRLAHEGYKRPLKFQCEFCDKAFTRHQVLKQHLRTHTGERPYECDKCAARFSQSNVLNTHVRLVHLNLARDGRPKPKLK